MSVFNDVRQDDTLTGFADGGKDCDCRPAQEAGCVTTVDHL
jgi:hypothetical protein